QRAEALGMAVIACDPFLPADHPAWKGARDVTLDRLLAEADVVSLHTPLTPDTRHMIDAAALGRMKKDAVLVNAARGGIVDEEALCAALREERIAGAALDVFEEEPLGAETGARFQGLKNLVLTPHIAGVTRESNVRVSHKTAQTVLEHLRAKA
ncbi:NAD(P)-dependent oxidoreductase, partial [Nitratireductor sp. GCM10026969]|uniref:NAD(P)-dependent oxidoreductase n=1 Tax=Nitratireductor sp. GCM10026969 TaxID=3252645 RepID=UPI003613A4ED